MPPKNHRSKKINTQISHSTVYSWLTGPTCMNGSSPPDERVQPLHRQVEAVNDILPVGYLQQELEGGPELRQSLHGLTESRQHGCSLRHQLVQRGLPGERAEGEELTQLVAAGVGPARDLRLHVEPALAEMRNDKREMDVYTIDRIFLPTDHAYVPTLCCVVYKL